MHFLQHIMLLHQVISCSVYSYEQNISHHPCINPTGSTFYDIRMSPLPLWFLSYRIWDTTKSQRFYPHRLPSFLHSLLPLDKIACGVKVRNIHVHISINKCFMVQVICIESSLKRSPCQEGINVFNSKY